MPDDHFQAVDDVEIVEIGCRPGRGPRRAWPAPRGGLRSGAGARFEGGQLVERDRELEAIQTTAEAVTDPTPEAPTASDQPVNNAA